MDVGQGDHDVQVKNLQWTRSQQGFKVIRVFLEAFWIWNWTIEQKSRLKKASETPRSDQERRMCNFETL